MEYQRKKKQILSTVEYSNLLTFSLVENKLERNFKSIVQALLLTQTEGGQLREDLNELARASNREMGHLSDRMGLLEKKMQDMIGRQGQRVSMKGVEDGEEIHMEGKTIQVPKVNVNYVESLKNTEVMIPSARNIQAKPSASAPDMTNLYDELKQKVDKLMSQQIDGSDLDKKLANMKDSINLLKAQMKAMTDRQAKSARRVSLQGLEKVEVPLVQPSTQRQKSSQDIKAMTALSTIQEELQKQINSFHIQINTMKLCLEQLKQAQSDLKRKDNKSHIQLDELSRNQRKLEERVQSANDTFEGQIKEMKGELLGLQTRSQEDSQVNNKKSRKNIEVKENISPNANNQINDRISKLQATIQTLVTESQFKRFKSEMKDKLSNLDSEDQNIRKELKEEVQMLTEILDTKQEQLTAIKRDIEQLKTKTNDMSSHCERKNNIAVSRHEQLKKNLQNLREDLEFYKSMNQATNETKVIIQPVGENSQDAKSKHGGMDKAAAQELKKYLNRKLHEQRTYLLGLIRDLEKKSGGGKTNIEQDLATFYDKIAEINLFLGKKANEDDVKKSLAYYQKKLATIYQRITSSDQNTEDARIAKTNWFCLSCDKNLHSYQGKVGQHVVWDSMPIKPGHAKFYNKEDKKSLPTLKR